MKLEEEGKPKDMNVKADLDLKDEETTVKDITEPLVPNLQLDGKKETRKAASKANELFKDFATKGHKNLNVGMNSHEKSDLNDVVDKTCRSHKQPAGKVTPVLRDEIGLSGDEKQRKPLQKT